MKQRERLKRLEEKHSIVGLEDGRNRLLDFLIGLSDRLTADEDATTASPAIIAALAIRDGHMVSPSVLQRAEAFSADPGPVGKLFKGILEGVA